jgi:DNA-binding response OmpR family regulator
VALVAADLQVGSPVKLTAPTLSIYLTAMKSEAWLDYATTSHFPSLAGGNLVLFPESNEAFVAGRNIHVSRTHFRILSVLLSDFCKTVSYQRIMGVDGRPLTPAEQNLLKVQMFHLRKLLKRCDAHVEIRNVYGQGYQARPTT